MKYLLTKERVIRTEYGVYRLLYRIHEIKEEGWLCYGVSIFQYNICKRELFDQAVIRFFSESLKDAKAFLETLVEGYVFPVHLYSIADDWFSAAWDSSFAD